MTMTLSLSQVVVWCNVVLAFIAMSVCAYASRHTFPELRPAYAAMATLALVYMGAYLWLALNLEQSAEWSRYVRPVGLIAWPIAWIAPPAVSVLVWFKVHHQLGDDE